MVTRLDYDRVAMLNRFRQFWTKVISPIANLLLRLGVSADAVTLVGTIGVCAGALIFFPRGHIWLGVVVITCFVFSDLIDGYMARTSGTSSKWGSYLDSTLDRLGDGAIFGGLVLYYAGSAGDTPWMAAVTLWALVMGATTSYARAKAESLGLHASGGIAERSDRLVSVLVIGFFSDVLNLPILLKIVLCALAVASTITVVQRTLSVRKQVLADPANAGLTPPSTSGTATPGAATPPTSETPGAGTTGTGTTGTSTTGPDSSGGADLPPATS
ncbi:CDP-diacylglycerol--glycerol-3-phosphate 3-phosphatidyltransferase/CDP-diacylglycerol--inositol 3-phosphatidyltransferase [Kribbella orskensis]|uniref:Phosphatidylinositol phosphate synthase n=2 Tax=Kribbellaceae TaxID=2726069 RepID=A0ABY2BGB2_9ACTN|nr:CDP-diacylglycerol--glycerol-3-phosphate 3-phosphatidyltransferase/CDP-diacylglycerol--inositol 3-phosphatidyltransferase [Kribbella sp. VKM Ac-2500]TCO19381.1 CDP-diacylglycerol--glycerol-3-phosphate 3-phosphatidyltransferase/CDP-diacylglycerol--inositol 3-phosphatidyltransferase [Kribbella orskensis]